MPLVASRPTTQIVRPSWDTARMAVTVFWAAGTLGIILAFAASVTLWTPAAMLAAFLVGVTAFWVSGGAATALTGLLLPGGPRRDPHPAWRPASRTAILVTLCKEDPRPLAGYLTALHDGLGAAGLQEATHLFVLSDTSGTAQIALEETAMGPLQRAGLLSYRRRALNAGRKPGNIADWVEAHGAEFDHMLVLDADSRMTPQRIRTMIWQMDCRPDLGLLQAGIGLRPGTTRFGHHQRVSNRLLAGGFGRGFAAWSGDSGNYWGHNAILRVRAFRAASQLPVLSGDAPWGGSILSHDFIEAAWIRRAGWAVTLDPSTSGSAEEAPQTLQDFHARDRRWCQGNLQHLRLIAAPGLDPVSRLHLAMGILSYLVAPLWLMLVLLIAFGAVPVAGALPLAVTALVLLLPKVCAVAAGWRAARTPARRAIVLRAALGELVVSSLIAPLVMLRQAGAVLSVAFGRDCGWKSTRRSAWTVPSGLPEAAAGGALLLSGGLVSGSTVLWLAPVALPLGLAPGLMRLMDARA